VLLPPAPAETAQAGARRVDCSSETVNKYGNCPVLYLYNLRAVPWPEAPENWHRPLAERVKSYVAFAKVPQLQ
jgi:hypothetical protein